MTNSTAYKIGGTGEPIAAGYEAPVRLLKLELDIADVASTVTTGGYAELMTLPAYAYIRFIGAFSVTALSLDSASSGRVDIGDEDDDDQFVTNQTTYTAGLVFTRASGGEYHTDGEMISATAGSLRIKLTGDKLAGGTANATGIIQVNLLAAGGTRVAQMTT